MDRQIKTGRLTRFEIKREDCVVPRTDGIENDWCAGIEDKVAVDIVRDCQLLRCLQRTGSEVKSTSSPFTAMEGLTTGTLLGT
jgi:hypothetical protein